LRLHVLIAERRSLIRGGLHTLLANIPVVENIYEATTNEDINKNIATHLVDLMLIDQSLITEITPLPRNRFAILAQELDRQVLQMAYEQGACGYLLDRYNHHCSETLPSRRKNFMSGQDISPTLAVVSFEISFSYEDALRSITALGLQPTIPTIGSTQYKGGIIQTWVPWSPVGEKELYAQGHPIIIPHHLAASEHPERTHTIWISPTPLAPTNWIDRLRAIVGVHTVEFLDWFSSPAIHTDPCPPGSVIALAEDQAGIYVRITFSLPANGYDTALYLISDLGLRLADPCYEQAKVKGMPLNWHLMEQENMFAHEQVLIVATTTITPSDWEIRLRNANEIVTIEVPYTVRC